MKNALLLLSSVTLLSGVPALAQDTLIEPGPFDGGRLRTNPAVDFHAFNQWIGLGSAPSQGNGNVGWNEEGIWWSFLRFPTFGQGTPIANPELFNLISGGGDVTLEIAVRWYEVAAALEGLVDPGVIVSCYLVPDMHIPDGSLPTWPNAWIGEFSQVFKFAEINPASVTPLRPSIGDFEFNPPTVAEIEAATISLDMTPAIEAAIQAGALTASTRWGIIFYTEESEPWTANDPKWADRRQTVLDLYNAVVRISEATTPTWGGYPITDDIYVDTGDWMGWIALVGGNWVWSYRLESFLYLPETEVGENGAWAYLYRSN